jgi:hypothetical protein
MADFDAAALEASGFTHDDDGKGYLEEFANKANMHNGGDYVVHGVWKRGMVQVHVETNTNTEVQDGISSVVTHPSVAVVSGPNGKIAVNATDLEGILSAADQLG